MDRASACWYDRLVTDAQATVAPASRTRRGWQIGGRRRTGGSSGLERRALSAPAVAGILLGYCLPLGVLLVYSFWPSSGGETAVGDWTLSNYEVFFSDSTYWQSLLRSFVLVGIAASAAVLFAFPFAYFVALRVRPQRRMLWIILAILPFSASYLIRVFAWLNLLGDAGILNDTLLRLQVISEPLGVFGYGRPAVAITFIYLLFPLSFIMSYVAIERMDPALLESASDLGARPFQGLAGVVLPIARTGLLAGFAFAFILVMGDYFTPILIGGTDATLFSALIYTKFGESSEWGLGSALAFLMLLSMLLFLIIARRSVGSVYSAGEFSRRYVPQRSPFLLAYALLFMVMLYTPILFVILFAFNESDSVGFPIVGLTTHWFESAFENPVLLDALRVSLTVAAWAVALSVFFGTLAAVQLARVRDRWRAVSVGVLALPLFLPPIMFGLGVIIGLNAIGVTRGLWTVILAHTLLLLPVVTFIVLVRLEGLDSNFERAATDLGARPWQAFVYISIPQALPGIFAAALIAFAGSMDEFIVTFLVTGTDVTLPLYIYSSLQYGINPELNALSAAMLVSSFLLCGLAAGVMRGFGSLRRRRHRRRIAAANTA